MEVPARQTVLVVVAAFLVLVEALRATFRIRVHAWIASVGSVVCGAVHAILVVHPGHVMAGGVVEHHVGYHVHAGRFALFDHAF